MPTRKTAIKKTPVKKTIKFKPATDTQVAAYIRWCRMVDNIEKKNVKKLVIPVYKPEE